jgi:probable HAF family extracellular repeat protein
MSGSRLIWLAALVLSLGATSVSLAKKPPTDPPPEPDPPPVAYKMILLGEHGGGTVDPVGLNNFGVMVGADHGGWICSIDADGIPLMRTLSLLVDDAGVPGSFDWTKCGAKDINDSGQICGYAMEQLGDPLVSVQRAIRYDPMVDPANAEVVGYIPLPLGTLDPADSPASTSAAYGINEWGDVTGDSVAFPSIRPEAFLWMDDARQMLGLGDLGGDESTGASINNFGDVCGSSYKPSTNVAVRRAFRKTLGQPMEDLGFIKNNRMYENSDGYGINDDGFVVGWANAGKYYHAFLDIPGVGMIDLGTLDEGYSKAVDINQYGDIVGNSQVPEAFVGAIFLWTPEHGMINVDETIENLPAEFKGWMDVRAINDHGWICGRLNGNSGSTEGFVLIPTQPLQHWVD